MACRYARMFWVYGNVDVVAPTSAPMLEIVASPERCHLGTEHAPNCQLTSARLVEDPRTEVFKDPASSSLGGGKIVSRWDRAFLTLTVSFPVRYRIKSLVVAHPLRSPVSLIPAWR